jgi:hypothetical protein
MTPCLHVIADVWVCAPYRAQCCTVPERAQVRDSCSISARACIAAPSNCYVATCLLIEVVVAGRCVCPFAPTRRCKPEELRLTRA